MLRKVKKKMKASSENALWFKWKLKRRTLKVFSQIRKPSGVRDGDYGKWDSHRSVISECKALQVKHMKNENGYTELIYLRITHNKRQPSVQSGGGEWEWTLMNRGVSDCLLKWCTSWSLANFNTSLHFYAFHQGVRHTFINSRTSLWLNSGIYSWTHCSFELKFLIGYTEWYEIILLLTVSCLE